MKSERFGVILRRGTEGHATITLGLAPQVRAWHLQNHNVGAVFEDAILSEAVPPGRELKEMRRKSLALARENARLAAAKAALSRENEEQSEEIGQLMDIASKSREELQQTQAKLASVEAELAESRRAVADTTRRRSALQPFWALGTPEARLLLVTVYLKGPMDVVEIIRQADDKAEVLEAICRLRTIGFIKFQQCSICVTVTGEAFARRLGFVK